MSEFDFQDGYRRGYYAGYVDALRLYAHWKDGVQYVGTCGRTLASAIEELDAEFRLAESKRTAEKSPQENRQAGLS